MRKLFVCLSIALPALFAAADPAGDQAVRAAMDAWKKATIQQDRAALEKLLHADLTYTHSSAKIQTKAEVIESVMTTKSRIEAIEFPDASVRVIGNTGLVNGMVDITTRVDGKPSVGRLMVLFVWVKERGAWQLVARQATRPAP